MSVIEYVSVFVSIVLGLAVAELGGSFHKLMRARRRVQWDWMSLVLAFAMLLEVVQFWWLSHDWYARSAGLRLVEFLPNLVLLLLIYLMAAAVLPDEVPEEGLSLRLFYVESAPYFWSLVLAMTVAIIAILGPRNAGTSNFLAVARNQSVNIVVLVAVAPLPFVRNIRVHQAVIIAFVGLVSWIYLSGLRSIH
ncbi:MAG: hypothetical protein ABIR08_03190 [Sphingomonas sp.]